MRVPSIRGKSSAIHLDFSTAAIMAPTKSNERQQPSNNRYNDRPRKIIAILRTAEDYHAFNTDPKTIARRNQIRVRAKTVMQQDKDNMHIMLQAMEDLDVKKPNPDIEDESNCDAKQKMAEFNKAKLLAANERKLMKTMLKMGGMGLGVQNKKKAKQQNERLMLLFEEQYAESMEAASAGGRMLAEGLMYDSTDMAMKSMDKLPIVQEAMNTTSGELRRDGE